MGTSTFHSKATQRGVTGPARVCAKPRQLAFDQRAERLAQVPLDLPTALGGHRPVRGGLPSQAVAVRMARGGAPAAGLERVSPVGASIFPLAFYWRYSQGVPQEVLAGARPAIWGADLFGAQLGHSECTQLCLAHQIRDMRYSLQAGDTIFAPGMLAFLQRVIQLGQKREQVQDRTLARQRRACCGGRMRCWPWNRRRMTGSGCASGAARCGSRHREPHRCKKVHDHDSFGCFRSFTRRRASSRFRSISTARFKRVETVERE